MLLACALCTAGRLDEAIETAHRAVDQDPESFIARWILGVSLGTAGRFEEAIQTLETAAGMSARHARALSSLAVVFGQWGKLTEAGALHRELLDRLRTPTHPSHSGSDSRSCRTARGGHGIRAAGRGMREPPFILHARHLPEFRTLRADPRFAEILTEMNEPLG
jgi:tetratricopeptide (TPR) repeat protein